MSRRPARRRGVVLPIVLAVVVLLSLAIYGFAEATVTERAFVARQVAAAQARQAALSAVDRTLAVMTDADFDPLDLAAYEGLFDGPMFVADDETPTPSFRVVAPDFFEGEPFLRAGPRGESGKIDLNALASSSLTLQEQRAVLLAVPEMTDTLADTILDFIDGDATPREYGTESDDGDFLVRNAPLRTLDDLAAIPDVDAFLLYGEDANRNGVLDVAEDDGDVRLPLDDADGVLWPGWREYVTVSGRESVLSPDGEPLIDVNALDAAGEQALATAVGADVAEFILAYLENGPADSASAVVSTSAAGTSGRAAPLLNASPSPDQSDQDGGNANLRSIYELVDARVEITVSRRGPTEVLTSPWSSADLTAADEAYALLVTSSAESAAGRIDLNFASVETLLGLPGMTESIAAEIVDGAGVWQAPGNLVTAGVVDFETFLRFAPFVTTRGGVFRFQAVGRPP
ncbi:MAG: hypothetical protein AAGJ97_14310, partial [Planctomycetota bacterium]